jgi:hypothetical protein
VLLRLKEDYDGAEPAASSVSVLNVLRLAHLTGDAAMMEKAEQTLGRFAARVVQHGRAIPMMLAALSTYHAGMPQIVIAGEPDASETQALIDVVRGRYLPTAIVLPLVRQHHESLSQLLPWTSAMRERDGQAVAYVCREFSCQAPATSPQDLDAQLQSLS